MSRWVVRSGGALAVGLWAALVVSAADEKKAGDTPKASEKSEKPKPPDFSGFVTVTTITGEIVTADATSATIRVFWQGPSTTGNRRPSLYGNNGRTMQNPRTARNSGNRTTTQHHDYVLEFVPQSLVRTRTLPTKSDVDGKTVAYTAKEREELKAPFPAPGYAASTADLTAGTIVEATVIRDKTVAANKLTEDDLRLKYVVIIGHDPNAQKNVGGGAAKAPAKKNNK